MYEIDFFAVGDGERSGDAIALRYTIPGRTEPVLGVIDAGFLSNGEELVEHIPKYYGTDRVDFVLSTHADADHINGMGKLVRELDVRCLLIHRPKLHGFASNTGAKPAEELTKLVEGKGGTVVEPVTGVSGWNGSFVIAGPTEAFYEEMLAEQTKTAKQAAHVPSFAERFLGTTVTKTMQKVLASFPIETPFGDAGGTNPRNNSSAILSLIIDERHLLFFGDAGVPTITEALDYLDGEGRTSTWPRLVVLPHHGSRHNLGLDTIKRMLGGPTSSQFGTAIASVSAESDNPSPRVANAVGRRGYPVSVTAGETFRQSWDARPRPGWNGQVTVLPPLVETDLED
jgi:glyoxylase-like metal-dependent hydrolase (beta-lactamase superfamily II)